MHIIVINILDESGPDWNYVFEHLDLLWFKKFWFGVNCEKNRKKERKLYFRVTNSYYKVGW